MHANRVKVNLTARAFAFNFKVESIAQLKCVSAGGISQCGVSGISQNGNFVIHQTYFDIMNKLCQFSSAWSWQYIKVW